MTADFAQQAVGLGLAVLTISGTIAGAAWAIASGLAHVRTKVSGLCDRVDALSKTVAELPCRECLPLTKE